MCQLKKLINNQNKNHVNKPVWAALHVALRQITVSVKPSWKWLTVLSVCIGEAAGDHVTSDVAVLCCEDGRVGVLSGCLDAGAFCLFWLVFICLYREMQEICLGGLTAAPWEVKFSLCSHVSSKPLLKTDDCSFRARWISINILDCSNWLCAIVMMENQ